MKLKALLLFVAVSSASATCPQQPNLSLQGDGHACSGSLRARQGRLHWKSSFSVCDATYRATSTAPGQWTLQLQKASASAKRSCSFASVTIQEVGANVAYPLWEVKGFNSTADTTATPTLDCNMQSVSPVTPHRKH